MNENTTKTLAEMMDRAANLHVNGERIRAQEWREAAVLVAALESRAARAEAEAGRLQGALETARQTIAIFVEWNSSDRRNCENHKRGTEYLRTRDEVAADALRTIAAALSPAPEPAAPKKGLGALLGKLGPFCERVPGCMCEPGHEGDCQVMAPGGKAETVAVKSTPPAAPEPAGALGEALLMLENKRHYREDGSLVFEGSIQPREVLPILHRAVAEQVALVKESDGFQGAYQKVYRALSDAMAEKLSIVEQRDAAQAARERAERAAKEWRRSLDQQTALWDTERHSRAKAEARVRELEAQLAEYRREVERRDELLAGDGTKALLERNRELQSQLAARPVASDTLTQAVLRAAEEAADAGANLRLALDRLARVKGEQDRKEGP